MPSLSSRIEALIERKLAARKPIPQPPKAPRTGPRKIADGLVVGKMLPGLEKDLRLDIRKHCTVAANPGSGKSVLAQIIANEVGKCADARLTLIDLGSGLAGWSAGNYARRCTTKAEAVAALDGFDKEHNERIAHLNKTNAVAIKATKAMPIEVVIVDEFQEFVLAGLGDRVGALMAKSRKTGILFVCLAPRGIEAHLPTSIRTMAGCRVAMKCPEPEQRFAIHSGASVPSGTPRMESAEVGELLALDGDGILRHGKVFTVTLDKETGRYVELDERAAVITAERIEWGCLDWGAAPAVTPAAVVPYDHDAERAEAVQYAENVDGWIPCNQACDLAAREVALVLSICNGIDGPDYIDATASLARTIIASALPEQSQSGALIEDPIRWAHEVSRWVITNHFPNTGTREGTVAHLPNAADGAPEGSAASTGVSSDGSSTTGGCMPGVAGGVAAGGLQAADPQIGPALAQGFGLATPGMQPPDATPVGYEAFGTRGLAVAEIIARHEAISQTGIVREHVRLHGATLSTRSLQRMLSSMEQAGWITKDLESGGWVMTAAGLLQLTTEKGSK